METFCHIFMVTPDLFAWNMGYVSACVPNDNEIYKALCSLHDFI